MRPLGRRPGHWSAASTRGRADAELLSAWVGPGAAVGLTRGGLVQFNESQAQQLHRCCVKRRVPSCLFKGPSCVLLGTAGPFLHSQHMPVVVSWSSQGRGGQGGMLAFLIGEPVFGHQILWARGVKKATCIHAKCHRLTLAAWAPKSSP